MLGQHHADIDADALVCAQLDNNPIAGVDGYVYDVIVGMLTGTEVRDQLLDEALCDHSFAFFACSAPALSA